MCQPLTPACEIALTGRNISPQEAKTLGMVSYVVPDDAVEAKALEIARSIASNSPDSVMATLYGVYLSPASLFSLVYTSATTPVS